ncbi:methylated-DNA--[protein]-cysteine S-methyltransferase [Lacimicrobium sp. SS2-24]|uniref:methylated-DNA--[protein]-cysteine S-methyltransferase n=1 Tax=Lacimicrobium sp. SS2-24 TaxID=2005569 RepID=UPI000B4A7AEA|nr:methylated-DNA--[protein]-cysteine S-methyltransferase [Lacimicrobium sp. SS2-24]
MHSLFMPTPLGLLAIRASEHHVQRIEFVDDEDTTPAAEPLLIEAKNQLQQYFDGQRRAFTLPLAAQGTAFQQTVWQALTHIDYGQTASYAQIADAISKPKAVRAVGAANGRNPLAIVVPCHRIIGKDGSLTGYAGGLTRKAWLLELEQRHLSPD